LLDANGGRFPYGKKPEFIAQYSGSVVYSHLNRMEESDDEEEEPTNQTMLPVILVILPLEWIKNGST